MPHDKIKAAARARMARTGEPYTAAPREDSREHEASAGQAQLTGTRTLVWINGRKAWAKPRPPSS
jgi:hypothetical protein